MLYRTPGEQLKPELEFVTFPYHSSYHFSLRSNTLIGCEKNVCLNTLKTYVTCMQKTLHSTNRRKLPDRGEVFALRAAGAM